MYRTRTSKYRYVPMLGPRAVFAQQHGGLGAYAHRESPRATDGNIRDTAFTGHMTRQRGMRYGVLCARRTCRHYADSATAHAPAADVRVATPARISRLEIKRPVSASEGPAFRRCHLLGGPGWSEPHRREVLWAAMCAWPPPKLVPSPAWRLCDVPGRSRGLWGLLQCFLVFLPRDA